MGGFYFIDDEVFERMLYYVSKVTPKHLSFPFNGFNLEIRVLRYKNDLFTINT